MRGIHNRKGVTVGLVQINSALNLTRQRWKGRKATGNRIRVPEEVVDDEAEQWAIFPYSVGLLQAFAQEHASDPGLYRYLEPLFKPTRIGAAADKLLDADIVGFSTYVWNIRLSLAIARRLKDLRPDTLIVFGGPQVPDDAESFLRDNRFIDVVCHGEGERTFLAILESDGPGCWEELSGASYLLPDGGFMHRPKADRIVDLSTIPSPYLRNVFAPIIEANPTEKWVLIWETNRGCPFACTFCDWGSAIASKVYQFDIERLRAEIDWYSTQEGELIFCCDANFGILPCDVEIAEYVAAASTRCGFPRTLIVQNTKNATERAYRVQALLADSGLNAGVTLALQSLDAHTLENVRRDNISTESFRELQRRYTRDGVETYTDMILSLPGETYVSWADGIADVIDHGQHNRVQFYNCSILPNAEMGEAAYQSMHGMRAVPQRLVDMHGSLDELETREVHEYIDTVVATRTLPEAEWVRAKALCWTTDLLYFDRLLQVPFLIIRELYGVSYRTLVETIGEANALIYPLLGEVRRLFLRKARAIQQGDDEYIGAKDWLNIAWPADQFVLIRLVTEWKIEGFYEEAEAALLQLLRRRALAFDQQLVRDAIRLNQELLRLPFHIDDLEMELAYNIWEYYESALSGNPCSLERRRSVYKIDRTTPNWLSWKDWYEHVVFCQNHKNMYLYQNRAAAVQTSRRTARERGSLGPLPGR